MSRSKRAAANGDAAPAQTGHNSDGKLTDEEAAALTTHFALKIIAQQKVVALKQAELDGERNQVNGLFKLVSKDLQITRKDFEANVIAVLGMSEAEYLSAERKRDRLHRLAGVKTGEQIDLIDHVLKDTVDEAQAAFADGYRAGRRADDPSPPTSLSTIFHQDWLKGWHEGQEFNALQLGKAAEILARPKPGEMAPAGDGEDGEDEDPADPEVIKRKAAKLKAEGWTEPTGDEASFEQAAA
jgi:ribosome modulation factor